MNNDPLAPKLNSGTLGGIMRDLKKRVQTGNYTKQKVSPLPNRFCSICSVVWRSDKILAGVGMQPSICDKCQGELDLGQFAAVCEETHEHCFFYSPALVGHKEAPIFRVTKETFAAMREKAKEQKE